MHDRDTDGAQRPLVTHTGQHQQVRGADCTGGQHDSIGGQSRRSGGSGDVHPDRPATGDSHPQHPGARHDAEIVPADAAPRNAAPGPVRTPSTMLSGTAPIPVGRPSDRAVVEIGQPGEPGAVGGVGENRGAADDFVRPPHRDRTTVAVCRTVREVEIGLDRTEVGKHLDQDQPSMAPLVEVGGHPTAEVAAVDRARTRRPWHPARGSSSAPGARSARFRTSATSGLPAPTGSCRPLPVSVRHPGHGRARPRLDDRHPAAGIHRKSFGHTPIRRYPHR